MDGYPGTSVALMERVAHLLALAIEHAVHVERLSALSMAVTKERDRARLLLDVTNDLASERDLADLLRAISQRLRDTVRHQYASVTLWDEEARQLRRHALVFPTSRGILKEGELLASQHTPPRLAFDRGETMVFQWADVEALDEYSADAMAAEGLRSVCCVPLQTARRKHGTLNVARPDDGGFHDDDVRLLEQIARQMAVAIENALAFTEISDLKDRLNEERLYLEDEITRQQDFKEIIGSSRALTSVLDQIRTVAPTDATVLLLGETGTGKELLARALHDLSRRRERTFVRVNGAALPAGLVESELFGYERGAFTGAIAGKAGRLEVAHRGTLFLDEVGDLPIEVQPKLLRAIQEREFERLGSTRTQRVDVRLIAATNRNLEEMVVDGTFRTDLYYRLSVFPIRVPALRDRPEDIPPLVHHFVGRFAREFGREISTIPRMVMDGLVKWVWPGNIRELENVIERAVIVSRGSALDIPAASFQQHALAPAAARPVDRDADIHDYRSIERDAIIRALRESRGVVGGPEGAAVRLGLKRTTLHSKMRKLGIARPSF
jgi:formate hydrogenlyase transcriptional activator